MIPDTSCQIVLASSSRYRKELLARLNLPFVTSSPDIDESPESGELPRETSLRLARLKALAVSRQYPNAIVIGSDQVAECDHEAIGKPGSFERAFEQLRKMRGKTVIFHTALCVINGCAKQDGEKILDAVVDTTVTFRDLPDEELKAYLKTDEPYDCAGSAKNETIGIVLLEKIESTDPTALTGLPLIALSTLLRQCGINFFSGKTE